MSILRRLSLALLLFLLLIGIAGHMLAPVGGSHHVLSESTCAIHHGMNLPANVQSFWIESSLSPEPTYDDTCVLDLVLKISHPPTL
jgi:hypothetical protein